VYLCFRPAAKGEKSQDGKKKKKDFSVNFPVLMVPAFAKAFTALANEQDLDDGGKEVEKMTE